MLRFASHDVEQPHREGQRRGSGGEGQRFQHEVSTITQFSPRVII
jgi:hypothetical protein